LPSSEQDIQRERLLKSTSRLETSTRRLDNSHRIAAETESIGAGILTDLGRQREQLETTKGELHEAEGYVDKSLKTLKDMSGWFSKIF